MGHRANYAVKDAGSLRLFFSHWGAKTVPADVFWGPAAAEAFILRNSPCDEWLDESDAEGAIAMDRQSRRAMFFGDGDLLGHPEIDETYTKLARRVWSGHGWELIRATGLGDVVEFCGLPRPLVEMPRTKLLPFPLAKIGENWAKGRVAALIAHITPAGLTDRVLDFILSGVLLNGPACLPYIAKLPTFEELRALPPPPPAPPFPQPLTFWGRVKKRLFPEPFVSSGDADVDRLRAAGMAAWVPPPLPYSQALTSFAILDETRREMAIYEPWSTDYVAGVRAAWPEWRVTPLADGAAGYFRRTGRPMPLDIRAGPVESEEPPPAALGAEKCLEEIERYLFSADDQKKTLTRLAREMKKAHASPHTIFAPGLTDAVPEGVLSVAERRRIWREVATGHLGTDAERRG